jgi:16S rRNA (adenine1518-N6/adenine1519-N6)-dimethyltransferase
VIDSPPPTPPPLRRFGQNFIHDAGLAQRLVELFGVEPGETIVEIGPGRGALTRVLDQAGVRLIALEIDPRQIDWLRQHLMLSPRCELVQADALQFDFGALASRLDRPLRVIGNLPYNVGTAIVRRMLDCPAVADMQFVLQLEVVERLIARPRTKPYGALSVLVQLTCSARQTLTLGPSAFHPRPKVSSAAVRLERRADASSPARMAWVEGWLQRGFGHRRKMLRSNLQLDPALLESALRQLEHDPRARAEELAPAEWLAFCRLIDPSRDPDR